MRPDSLSGLTVLVTGASAGLGAACVKELANRGARVIAVARRGELLAGICASASRSGIAACPIVADLGNAKDVRAVIRTVMKLGGADVLVNNAAHLAFGPRIWETDEDAWLKSMDINLSAPFLLARGLVPEMLRRGEGKVINVVSATRTLRGMGPFRVSKVGLEVLTAILATELRGSAASATAFNPGWMKTESSLSGRSPAKVAKALGRLLELPPRSINGQRYEIAWVDQQPVLRRSRRGVLVPGFRSVG